MNATSMPPADRLMANLARVLPALETAYKDIHDANGSPVPVAHSCGHDMHEAWLLGATAALSPALRGYFPAARVQAGVEAMVVGALAWLAK
jgi:metal-dependent amidase/aminoacylase/carboxypeptidase family protein